MENTFYEDKKIYIVSVMDLTNPDATTFTVGINGDVRNYPTREDIKLNGAQIKMLLDCMYKESVTEVVNGLNVIKGYKATPRFAINVKGIGEAPIQGGYLLGEKIPETKKETAVIVEAPSTDEIPEVEKESSDDRKAQLEAATRQELMSFCKGKGINFTQTDSKTVLIGKILRYELAEGK